MPGDSSGLTGSTRNLVVDRVGAFLVAVLGYGHLETAGSESFLERWIDAYIAANPRLIIGEEGSE